MITSNAYVCELDKCTNSKLTLFLYNNVKNLTRLKQRLLTGELRCSILKANLICSPYHVTVAANKAMIAKSRNAITTKSIYTELLYNLSMSKNITDSLSKFGIDDKQNAILIAFIDDLEAEGGFDYILNMIDGEQLAISDLENLHDENLIKKIYKISDVELEVSDLIDSVTSRISIKGFA